MKRILGVVIALCFVVMGMVAFTPATSAKATSSPFATVQHAYARALSAYDNGGLQVGACRSDLPTESSSLYVDDSGNVRNTLAGPSASNGASCSSDGGGYGAEDGTLYGMRNASDNSTSTLVAWKNNRQLWEVSTTSPTNCVYSGSPTNKVLAPRSISEGPDGNIYLVLNPQISPQGCDDRLMGVNPKTGSIIFNVPIGAGPAPGSGLAYYSYPTAWTYSDAIVVVDRSGVVREFNYSGVENTSVAYQLIAPTGHRFGSVVANDEGTVFAITYPSSSSAQPALSFHKRNGVSGSITDSYAWPSLSQLQPTSDGNVVGIANNGGARIDHFDLSTSTMSVTYPTPHTTGYSTNNIGSYAEDENGNQLTVWSHWDSSTNNTATSVDVYDPSTSSTSTIYLREKKTSDLTNYPEAYDFFGGSIGEQIGGGNLYLSVCEHNSSTCFSSPTPDISIYKVSTGNFDRPIGKGYKRNSYSNSRLEYVAMGDSYSSGEGNPPFLNTKDDCDRSTAAYPYLLVSNYSLNYKLVDHVACSGATTADLLHGKYDEPSQTSVLSDNTSLVTVTIGGNDAAFAYFATECVTSNCGPGSTAYTLSMGNISDPDFASNLEVVYETILQKAPNAAVYVVGYPYVTSDTAACYPFTDTTPGTTVTDAVAARNVVDALNARSASVVDAINDTRLHFIDPTEAGNPFEGNDICSLTSDFVYPSLTATHNWLHPNASGQEDYADLIASSIISG